jgi:chorismate-pyruvate lyase
MPERKPFLTFSLPVAPSQEKPRGVSHEAKVAAGAMEAIAYPLNEFYAQAGIALPSISPVPGDTVPQPYRTLLVHQNDMTPTLEQFYKTKIHLQILRRQQKGDLYFREVILLLDGSNRPVEFGAIKIHLDLFPPEPRKLILEERLPLGRILAEHNVPHFSRPKAFLCIRADCFIRASLKFSGSPLVYGRRNTLINPEGRPLAEIVEILPPESDDPRDGAASMSHITCPE